MSTTLLKSLKVGGVEIEIRVSNEEETDTTKQFIYELLNFDND